jgi:hypothetical protein
MKKFDSVGLGIAAGIILPALVFLILYYTKVMDIRYILLSDYSILSTVLPLLISHCVLPDIILFFICNSLDRMLTAKGVVIATVIMATGVFATKLITALL